MAMNESGPRAPCAGPGASREFRRSMKRRCLVHDYKGRSIYMVTLEVAGRRPLLGRIVAGLRPAHRTGEAKNGDCPTRAGQSAGGPAIPLSAGNLGEAELKAVNAPLFEPSELGRRVAEEFMKIGEHVPGVKPLLAQAMPDHFHGVLFVTREIGRPLGSIMAGFKGKCSQVARELGVAQGLTPRAPDEAGLPRVGGSGAPRVSACGPGAPRVSACDPGAPRVGGSGSPRVGACGSLWEPGYHDRILTSEGQLEKMIRYVIDNPRRAALRFACRGLFTGVRRLSARGRDFEAYGNGFLLQRAEIAQVQCSRRFFGFRRQPKADGSGLKVTRDAAFETPEFAARKAGLFEAAKRGAVLCSPCISDGEKAIAYAAVDAGCPLIVLRNEPFPPRFKPGGRFFDACAEGRLLILRPLGLTPRAPNSQGLTPRAPNPSSDGGRQPARITRAECLTLNALVAEICGGDAGDLAYHGATPFAGPLKASVQKEKTQEVQS